MSRFVNEDFNLLLNFLTNYSLKSVCKDECFIRKLKVIHKVYLSLLVFSSEINLVHKTGIDNNTLLRMTETSSDVGASLLLLSHGMYKQANMSLRSSIENFSKTLCYEHDNGILTEKSVSSIFDKTKKLPLFNNKVIVQKYSDITSAYSKLCAFTHTATADNMSNISALNSLPTFQLTKTDEFIICAKQVVCRFLYIFIERYRHAFFKFSQHNRDIILNILTPTERRCIMEPKI